MHRNPDGAGLVGDGAGDRLANPPGGVGGELVATAVFELVHGFHQADVAFLDQVQELQAAVGVFLGDGDHQAQVGLDHFFLGAACLGFADGDAAVDLLDVGHGQADDLFQGHDLALVALDVFFHQAQLVGVVLGLLALERLIHPVHVGFVAGEDLDEVTARHAGAADRQRHDVALEAAHGVQVGAGADQQLVVDARHQFEQGEVRGQGFLGLGGAGVVATVAFERTLRLLVELLELGETLRRQDRVQAAFVLFFLVSVGAGGVLVGVVLFVVVLLLGFLFFLLALFFLRRLFRFLALLLAEARLFVGVGGGGAVVVGVQVAGDHVGELSLFVGDALVLVEDHFHGAGPEGEGVHDFTGAFLDALGDLDFAFPGEQLHGAHFAHVHAHRVGGAARFVLHGGEHGGGFFGGHLVGAFRALIHHDLIGVGGFLHHADAHVVDHLDDVFHLIRVGDGLGQVVVHLGIGQVALFLAQRDQLLQL